MVLELAEEISQTTSGFIQSSNHRDLLDIVDSLARLILIRKSHPVPLSSEAWGQFWELLEVLLKIAPKTSPRLWNSLQIPSFSAC